MGSLPAMSIALVLTVFCVDIIMCSPMADPNVNVDFKVNVNDNGKGDSGGHHDSDYCAKHKLNCGHWCYPSKNWPYYCSNTTDPSGFCNQPHQSPIDICPGLALKKTGSFTFSPSYSVPIDDLYIKNNGHTVSVSWAPSNAALTIDDGGLPGEYTLAGFHFHWGCEDDRGSEHVVEGTRYAMELHFVHFKSSYGTLSAAIQNADGLAVLGVFFNIGAENAALKPITNKLQSIVNPDPNNIVIPFEMALIDLIPTERTFYRYQGSLTTPTCNEVVTWSIFKSHLTFSQAQADAFRSLMEHGDHQMCDNYRGIQPVNGRQLSEYS